MRLDGKHVLVTGGSSGIGFQIAKALFAKGAKVAITGRPANVVSSAVEELRDNVGLVTRIAADVGTGTGAPKLCGVRSDRYKLRFQRFHGGSVVRRLFAAGPHRQSV